MELSNYGSVELRIFLIMELWNNGLCNYGIAELWNCGIME